METKVTYEPIGRLGNQMFQCAAAIGYAKKHKVGWACPSNTKESPRFHEYFPNLRKHDGHEFKRYNVADPSQFNYAPIPFNDRGLKLVGFFQSEKYFEGAHDEVRKAFRLNIEPTPHVYTSVHIRRGDYLDLSGKSYPTNFPPINELYLQEAVDHVHHAIGYVPRLIVFSDDIKWCKNYFKDYKEGCVTFSEGRNEFEDLSLMASCSHHIIANSTFSWWGAWLGYNPNKIVVSPSQEGFNWFGPDNGVKNPKDLIPDSWYQIKFR
jgi:hypothetical protein